MGFGLRCPVPLRMRSAGVLSRTLPAGTFTVGPTLAGGGWGRWLVPPRTSSAGVLSQPFPVRTKHKIYIQGGGIGSSALRENRLGVILQNPDGTAQKLSTLMRREDLDGSGPTPAVGFGARARATPHLPGRPILRPFRVAKRTRTATHHDADTTVPVPECLSVC